MNKLKYLIIAFLATAFFSCDTNEGSEGSDTDALQKSMIENVSENVILARYSSYKNTTEGLNDKIMSFAEAPSIASLNDLKSTFEQAYLEHQYNEFNIDPKKVINLSASINVYPANPENIEDNIQNEILKVEDVRTSEKGYPALEYLLYSDSEDKVVEAFVSNASRGDYLKNVSNDIVDKVQEAYMRWSPEGDNEAANFYSNNKGLSKFGALSMMTNGITQDYEWIKKYRVHKPLLIAQTGEEYKGEGHYSKLSVKLIKKHLEAYNDFMNGGGDADFEMGLYNYLDAIEAKVDDELMSAVIKSKIKTSEEEIAKLDDSKSMDENITMNSEQVWKVYDSLQSLVSILKVDMVRALGVQVDYQDSDGD
ncbi:imelysin family protein [Aureibacter tunicatorum]|uniref:Lipoprotein n=1 Tax=Aureibacter tunicatorum TaxID=866807 RepID=A0AAE3XHG4_9BACT|nr:imelysin family protein [Aureibacter tunicatorum]MDR6237756.1 putative lipoprotein [Aureibacter tunicatorum]BDD02791.1 iron-regulated protein A precursor [Aureibacter tunicatorum]